MNCPVCDRILAPTLSICPSCGAMMNDTVREELQTKITTGAIQKIQPSESLQAAKLLVEKPVIKAAPPIRRAETVELTTAKTSPTLIEFQNKTNVIPEWRLQMQNAVQQRMGTTATAAKMAPVNDFPVNGPASLKVQPAKSANPIPAAEISDPRVASALKRINDSRKTYLPPAKAWKKSSQPIHVPMKPYRVAPTPAHVTQVPSPTDTTKATLPKMNVLAMPVAAPRRETNELPKLDPAIERAFKANPEPLVVEALQPIASRIESPIALKTEDRQSEFGDLRSIRIKAEAIEIEAVALEETTDGIEDLAPFSMRFGAGLFDLIIGGFAALLLLSPLAFTGGNWWSTGGFLTFVAVWAIVSFLYMTITLGFYGKTFGMTLFSLELVDAVENEYPTLQQAAVNSGLFILSLPFAGAGFLMVFFNDENRALHDLASGTILVREF
jgi:uncharacterized RDD family membrane protein YckC